MYLWVSKIDLITVSWWFRVKNTVTEAAKKYSSATSVRCRTVGNLITIKRVRGAENSDVILLKTRFIAYLFCYSNFNFVLYYLNYFLHFYIIYTFFSQKKIL